MKISLSLITLMVLMGDMIVSDHIKKYKCNSFVKSDAIGGIKIPSKKR